MVLLGNRRHRLRQDSINAKLDTYRVIARFDMNITGTPLQRSEDGGVDQPNNWAYVALSREAVDGDSFIGPGFIFANHVQRKSFAGVFQNALGLFGFLENLADLTQGGNFGDDTLAQQQADLINHHQLAGVRDGDGEPAIFRLFQRHEVIAEHQVDGNLLEQVVMQLEIVQVHKLAAIAPCDILGFFQFLVLDARDNTSAISAARQNRLVIRYCRHHKSVCSNPNMIPRRSLCY
jgi:hypothetical protein